MKDSGRRWLIAAVGLFMFLLVGWVLLALQLNVALAGPLPFGPGLMSKLNADYSPDERGRSVALISLSILDEAMQALGYTDEEAAAAHERLEEAMSQPVPTATAMDFDGAAPFTATPTVTNTPLPTDAPTPTPTNTRPPPTRTPKPTKTPEPADTAGPEPTSVATSVPTAAPDTSDPVIEAAGATFDPPPGPITTCDLTVTGVHITDGPGSSGISGSQVGILYDSGSGDITLSGMTLVSGGLQPDTSWDGYYSGSFTLTGVVISYLPGGKMALAAPLASEKKHLNIYVFAFDGDGNFGYDPTDFDYDVYVNC